MKSVLGIDAAWTVTQPSGIAVAVNAGGRWKLVGCASSYQRFLSLADPNLTAEAKSLGSRPDAALLIAAASSLADRPIDLVAIDMPLSMQPISGRRTSDDAVSRTYGARYGGTHTPSALRPGPISDLLRLQFEHAGYPLRTTSITTPGLIEVYPHPALIELARAPERLKYKIQKASKYWPSISPQSRREQLVVAWTSIIDMLGSEIDGVSNHLEVPQATAPGAHLKAFEDMLDAVVCCWVATCALEGRAIPFGDDASAIWIPAPVI